MSSKSGWLLKMKQGKGWKRRWCTLSANKLSYFKSDAAQEKALVREVGENMREKEKEREKENERENVRVRVCERGDREQRARD